MLIWLICTAIIILFYLYIIKPNQYWKKLNVPYMKPWPFFGNTASFIFRQKTISEWNQGIYNSHNSRYVGFYSFLKPILMLKDLDLIKQLTIVHFDNFCDRRNIVSEEQDPLFGRTLLTLKGERWKQMRSTLSPAFTGSKMRQMFSLISDCAQQFNDHFLKLVHPNEPLVVEMKDIFSRVANDIIATTAFGFPCNSLKEMNNEFYLMTKETANFSGLRALKIFVSNISKTIMNYFKIKLFSDNMCNFYRNIVMSNVTMRKKDDIIRHDMIHLLMEARKGNLRQRNTDNKTENDGSNKQIQRTQYELEDDDMVAQVLLFVLAGFDTTSIMLSHTSYELALNEDVQDKLLKEVDATFEACNGILTYEAILEMKYLDMVLNESLRKWPPFTAVDRECINTFTIPPKYPNEVPLTLHKGDDVWIPVFAIHRDPKYYPNPEKFDPERFSEENKRNIFPFSYLPFGIGPRNCIGSRLAILEAKTIFFYILSKFKFVVVEKTEIPLRLNKTQFTVTAENGFWLGLQLR